MGGAMRTLGQLALLVGHEVAALNKGKVLKVQLMSAGRRRSSTFATCAYVPTTQHDQH